MEANAEYDQEKMEEYRKIQRAGADLETEVRRLHGGHAPRADDMFVTRTLDLDEMERQEAARDATSHLERKDMRGAMEEKLAMDREMERQAQAAALTGQNVGDLVVAAMSDGSVSIRDADGHGGWLLGPFQAINAGQQLISMATELLLTQARKGQIEPVSHARPRIFTGIPRQGERD